MAHRYFHAVFVLILLLCLYSCAMQLNRNEGPHQVIRGWEQCGQNIINSSGLIVISTKMMSTTGSQICAIQVDDAKYLHLMIRKEEKEYKKDSHNISNSLQIAVYDREPGDAERPLNKWNSEVNKYVKIVTGNKLWLVITYDILNRAEFKQHVHWLISYTAQYDDRIPECNISKLKEPENGIIDGTNHAFGSVVNLQCSEGYILENGQDYAVCSIDEGVLSWTRTEAFCSSTCNHPPAVQNASAHIETEYYINDSMSEFIDKPATYLLAKLIATRPNTTVSYVCHEPFVASGSHIISCRYDMTGTPHWLNSPPSCIPPSSSASINLQQHSGIIASPSYHSSNFVGGSLMWLWEICGPGDSYIHLNISDIQLPNLPGVEVVIYEIGSTIPRPLLTLTSQSQPVNINSLTSKVAITFRRPSSKGRGHRMFSVRYRIVPKSSRIRRKRSDTIPAPIPQEHGQQQSESIPAASQDTEIVLLETSTEVSSTFSSVDEYSTEAAPNVSSVDDYSTEAAPNVSSVDDYSTEAAPNVSSVDDYSTEAAPNVSSVDDYSTEAAPNVSSVDDYSTEAAPNVSSVGGNSERLSSPTTASVTGEQTTNAIGTSDKNDHEHSTGDTTAHSDVESTAKTTKDNPTDVSTNGPANSTSYQITSQSTEQLRENSTEQSTENSVEQSTYQTIESLTDTESLTNPSTERAGVTLSTEQFTGISTQWLSQTSTQESVHNYTQEPDHTSTQQSIHTSTSTEQSNTTSIDLSNHTSTQEPHLNSTLESNHTFPEQSNHTFPERSNHTSTQEPHYTSTQESNHTFPEQMNKTSTEQIPYQQLNASTEQTTEQTTKKVTTTNHSEINTLSSTLSQNDTTPISEAAAEEPNDDWKIAVGVVIPIIFLVAVLVGVYICYRKKYPVRMIIGREFGKFSNPSYESRDHAPSLVREDADFYFTSRKLSNVRSQEFNPINSKIVYDNRGFIKDDGDDEDEKERTFLQSKSWLFKKTTNEEETKVEIVENTVAESSFTVNHASTSAQGSVPKRIDKRVYTDNDISEILVDETLKPVAKPRLKKKIHSSPSGNSDQQNERYHTPVVTSAGSSETAQQKDSYLTRSAGLSDINELGTANDKNENVTKRQMKLFQQPSFDEVWDDVKARSKSLSNEDEPADSRRRSLTVDTSKSARKMSLHDEFLPSRTKVLDPPKLKTLDFDGRNTVSAFVVGVDIRDRQASTASSVLSGEDIVEFEPEKHNERSFSNNSLYNNFYGDIVPHLEEIKLKEDYNKGQEEIATKISSGYYIGDNSIKTRPDTEENKYVKDTSISYSTLQEEVDEPDSSFVSASRTILQHVPERETSTTVSPGQGLMGATTNRNIVEANTADPSLHSPQSSENASVQESSNASFPTVLSTSKLQTSLADTRTSNTVGAEIADVAKNTIKHADVNIQDGGKVAYYDDELHKQSSRDREQTFNLKSRDQKSSSSSNESVLGSSQSSRGTSSDDDDKTKPDVVFDIFKRHQKPYDTKTDSLDEDLFPNLAITSKSTPPSLHRHGDDAVTTHITPDTSYPSKDDISKLEFSDSSSDSSQILPNRDVPSLSRQPLSSTYKALDKESPGNVDTHEDLMSESGSEEYQSDDDDGRDGSVGQILFSSASNETYRLRDDDDHEQEVDV